jgi:hypothetical protein
MQTDQEKIDSLKDKIKRCANIIEQSLKNNTIGIPINIFTENIILEKLQLLGIYSDADSYDLLMSEDCKEGDFRKIFCEEGSDKIPIPRFRKIWGILKEGSTLNKQVVNYDPSTYAFNILKPIGQYSDEELLKRYGPDRSDSDTEEELRKRSKDRNFIVFNDKGIINTVLTLKFLRESRRRDIPKVFNDGIKTYILYKVGEFPQEVYDICPVTGNILFEDYSEKIGIKWKIPLDAKQFVWIMSDQGIEINPIIVNLLTSTYNEKGIDGLKDLYPNIGIIYEDLKIEGKLPSLKSKNKITKQDPFGKRY